ncbi:MAG: polyphosphate kinase 1 [Leptospiraceae bacterium]|nr:polyphosphate kinase 1 [Leptospiraceae bacterium]
MADSKSFDLKSMKQEEIPDIPSLENALPLDKPEYYINREASWLKFNHRVLEEAQDKSNPLLERVRFMTICESNLDEYFMVRVAGIRQKIANDILDLGPDNFSPRAQLELIQKDAAAFYKEIYNVLNKEIIPDLNALGFDFVAPEKLTRTEAKHVKEYFLNEIFPILTPLAIDPGHPFPRLMNRSLNLGVLLRREKNKSALFAVVQVPTLMQRLYLLPGSNLKKRRYIWLEDIIIHHIDLLFSGFEVQEVFPFKLTRDSDLIIEEDEVDDLLLTIQQELRQREKGAAVRLEINSRMSTEMVSWLKEALNLTEPDIYQCDGPLPLSGYKVLFDDEVLIPESYRPFMPLVPVEYDSPSDIFNIIKKHDIFMHHPFDSFSIVEDFISAAADDPNVLAIKQTLYRTGTKSRILDALMRAARNGKQVTALVELKARFDEETNIQWAKIMEAEGVHVVYGLMGLKTHSKVAMVIRREGNKLERYVHMGSGNYNAITARLYTDTGLLTRDPEIGEDITHLFNSITGYARLPKMRKVFTSPGNLKNEIIRCIRQEKINASKKKPARIIAKMNSLVDADVIQELYKASQFGVQIDLIIRGICCLRPGIPGISENIRVRSIVGRLLEHSRIFVFENSGSQLIYFSSADWMPRNFNRRIELLFPIENEKVRSIVLDDLIQKYLSGNVKTRVLQADGSYVKVKKGKDEDDINVQEIFIERSRAELDVREKKSGQKKTISQKQKKKS